MRWKRLTTKQSDALASERRAKKTEANLSRHEREADWHQWFAWHPVRDKENGYGMFMETVLRKSKYPVETILDRLFFAWDYRPMTILPKDLGLAPDDENGPTPRNG